MPFTASESTVANREVSAIRAALSDHVGKNETTPRKRSLGTIVLYPTAFQCPWANRLARGEICADGTTINTDDGDTFESVHHWVQAEQRREMMAIVKESRLQMEEERQQDAAPGTPAPFGFKNSMNEQQSNLDVQKALAAFKGMIQTQEWDDEEEDEDDLYNFDDEEEENENSGGFSYQSFQSPHFVEVRA